MSSTLTRFVAVAQVACVAVTALGGCSEPRGYTPPKPDTDPEVTLPYPEARIKILGETGGDITFGEGSADLLIAVAGQYPGSTNRVLNLAGPGETRLHGYGEWQGYTEIYRRMLAVDSSGVHGVRTAVYRTDPDGNHTNAWFSHWASNLRDIYQTELAVWDWQGGHEDLTQYSGTAWPMFDHIESSGPYYASRLFGITPGIFSRTDYAELRVLDTDMVAPTVGLGDCTLLSYFSHEEDRYLYLAYVHEVEGLVEVAYEFEWLNDVADDWRAVASSGFALAETKPGGLSTSERDVSVIGGSWRDSTTAVRFAGWENELGTVPSTDVPLAFELDIDPRAVSFRAESGLSVIRATYRDADLGERRMIGIFRKTGGFKLMTGQDIERVVLTGVAENGPSGQVVLRYRYVRSSPTTDPITTHVEESTLERAP